MSSAHAATSLREMTVVSMEKARGYSPKGSTARFRSSASAPIRLPDEGPISLHPK